MKHNVKLYMEGILGQDREENFLYVEDQTPQEIFDFIEAMDADNSCDVYCMGGIAHPRIWRIDIIK